MIHPYISKGNSKVLYPIFSLGSGTHCPSAGWCRFSLANYKRSGSKLCYAAKVERIYPSVLRSRMATEAYIEAWNAMHEPEQVEAIVAIAERLASLAVKNKAKHSLAGRPTVRLNEAGDLCKGNIAFACALIRTLVHMDVNVYLYSKASPIYRKMAEEAGATVLHSEHDFIAVQSREDGEKTGHIECKGTCGKCQICPNRQKAWILEH